MIKPLRKYHFYIWRMLAIALPVIFALAIFFRPDSPDHYRQMKDDFSFGLKKLADSTLQINIEVKNALKVPSCLVYVSATPKDILLGKLDHQGVYHFEIENQPMQDITLRLYDAIHKKEIGNIQLTDNNE
jgi:hypothetical protein